jgi:spermidine synthase
MGLTLPLVSGSTLVRGDRVGSRVGVLYAVNTAGATTGALLAGFHLIGGIGMRRTFFLAAAVNVSVGMVALWMARPGDDAGQTEAANPAAEDGSGSTRLQRAVVAVVFLTGFASLALEVVWFRILLQFVSATTYAFTTMLATVLAGIALGGAIAARRLRRIDHDWPRALARVSAATGLSALLSIIFLAWSYQQGWRTSGVIQASAAAILPAAVCMGLSLPIALRVAALGQGRRLSAQAVARAVGRLYAVNVMGAIAGALAGGFVLLPWLGSRVSLVTMAALFLGAAFIVAVVSSRRRRLLAGGTATLVVFLVLAARVPDPLAATIERRHGGGLQELFRHEGAQTAVTVYGNRFRRVMFLDGLHQANDEFEMVRVHATIGHLPMLLHPAPEQVLVIGLGGGVTAGAVAQHAGASVQVVELSEGVRRAAALFAHVNFDVLRQPNVRLRVDDGRNFLKVTATKYDVITADIIQPIHAGSGNLYSREYFSLVRNALKPGGLFMQWIGRREPSHYRAIMRTFIEVFPDATLWREGDYLIGTLEPLRLTSTRVAGARRHAPTAHALDALGIDSDETLRGWYTGGAAEMRRFTTGAPLLTDDQPLVEYHLSLDAGPDTLDIEPLRGSIDSLIAD